MIIFLFYAIFYWVTPLGPKGLGKTSCTNKRISMHILVAYHLVIYRVVLGGRIGCGVVRMGFASILNFRSIAISVQSVDDQSWGREQSPSHKGEGLNPEVHSKFNPK